MPTDVGGHSQDVVYADGELQILWEPPALRRDESAPTPDVSRLPGAHLVADRLYRKGNTTVRVGCARGPSSRFVPGLEGVLFDRATAFALKTADLHPEEWHLVGTSGELGRGLLGQSLRGKVDGELVSLDHQLTFVGDERDVLLCSSLCAGDTSVCSQRSWSVEVQGHRLPPEPGVFARVLFFTATHPYHAMSGLLVLAVALSAWLLRRRKRRRYLGV